jgi:nucleotide-binding universal stress UspA family protein
VSFGPAGKTILNVAAERTPDLIVLGVTQPAEGAFAGRRWTNASEVTGDAACPVLTIRGVAS